MARQTSTGPCSDHGLRRTTVFGGSLLNRLRRLARHGTSSAIPVPAEARRQFLRGISLRSSLPHASRVPLTRNLAAAGPSHSKAMGGHMPLEEPAVRFLLPAPLPQFSFLVQAVVLLPTVRAKFALGSASPLQKHVQGQPPAPKRPFRALGSAHPLQKPVQGHSPAPKRPF